MLQFTIMKYEGELIVEELMHSCSNQISLTFFKRTRRDREGDGEKEETGGGKEEDREEL